MVLEVGVGGGATSVIINQFMKAFKINRPFLAIDTFFMALLKRIFCSNKQFETRVILTGISRLES